MSQVAPAQVSFNAGEISRRLRARIDQSLYSIALAEMVGFAPLVEGPAEAAPGTIHVAALPGPARLVRFEYSTTQGHVLAFGDGTVRVFTNDALLATITSPYSWAQAQALTFHESYDVLYCFHPTLRPRTFTRTGADTFTFAEVGFTDGPFERTNRNKGLTVSASGVRGSVSLSASAALFAAGDAGGLFRMEVTDFGDITAWEPYITVTRGQYLTANERVYQVVGGNGSTMRTGTLTPVHVEGVEWDGIAKGTDINNEPAGGVRLEYIHDRYGVLRIDSVASATQASATVLRRLPFSTAAASYTGGGTYYGDGWEVYEPPVVDVAYAYGTHRWSFGAFSDRRGWPSAGCVWNERLCLAHLSTVHASVRGQLDSFAELNEAGEASEDMAVIAILQDPNPIRALVPADRLLALTAGGVHALFSASAAAGFGPSTVTAEKQNDAGCAEAAPVALNSRTLYIDRTRGRIYETDFEATRRVEQEIDLTRYARHIGAARFVDIAAQQNPFNHLWTTLADGTLALAAYLPEESVLGFARRPLAEGVAARSICTITDPAGEYDQVWIAAEYDGGWHILRMAPWRQEGDASPACMVDMAAEHDGAAQAGFTHPALRDCTLHVVADGAFYEVACDAAGAFTLPVPASQVWAGLPFPAHLESLDIEMGGDNGPARARKARFLRSWVEVDATQGLAFGTPGALRPLEELQGDSDMDSAFPPFSGFRFVESAGSHTRHPRLRIERHAPFPATVMAWGGSMDMATH